MAPLHLRSDAVKVREAFTGKTKEWEDTMTDLDEQGGKAYALYSSLRRFFEPLREHWSKLTPHEQQMVIKEVEAFLDSVRKPGV
jgi:hypothetical protein